MPNGIIIIDKPAGWTSMDVCAKLRGLFHEKRVGHSGTLDPMATGALPVFVGRATRAVEFAETGDKEYLAVLRLGLTTNTQDTSGEVLERRPAAVTRAELEAVLPRFTGALEQVPPMYSAIKVNGQKLYDIARRGGEVERKPRPVTIYELEAAEERPAEAAAPYTPSPGDVLLRVRCSKGTYIRTLCHDIGQALGCGGCMAALRRTAAAGFTLDDAVTLDDLLSSADPAALLRPVESLFARYPAISLAGRALSKAKNGNPFPCAAPDGTYRFRDEAGAFLLLGEVKDGEAKTIKSFFEVTP